MAYLDYFKHHGQFRMGIYQFASNQFVQFLQKTIIQRFLDGQVYRIQYLQLRTQQIRSVLSCLT